MFYEYSRQARLMRYTDVLGQTQEYEYNERAQMIATRLGDTRSMFVYDDWAQLVSIETIDGSQRLRNGAFWLFNPLSN
jgi:YD repeat-containing protein